MCLEKIIGSKDFGNHYSHTSLWNTTRKEKKMQCQVVQELCSWAMYDVYNKLSLFLIFHPNKKPNAVKCNTLHFPDSASHYPSFLAWQVSCENLIDNAAALLTLMAPQETL